MPRPDEVLQLYQDVAQMYDRQGQPKLRDWFLVLSADAALAAGWEEEAERIRVRLLSYTPHHLLKPFASFAEAMRSPDMQSYIQDLRRTYTPETARQLLGNQKPSPPQTPAASDSLAPKQSTPPVSKLASALEPKAPSPHSNAPAFPSPIFDEQSLTPRREKPSSASEPLIPSSPQPKPTPPSPEPDMLPSPQRPNRQTAVNPPFPASVPPFAPSPLASPPVKSPSKSKTDWQRSLPFGSEIEIKTPLPSGPQESTAISQWVCTGLAFLVALLGLALAAYTILRPLMGKAWPM